MFHTCDPPAASLPARVTPRGRAHPAQPTRLAGRLQVVQRRRVGGGQPAFGCADPVGAGLLAQRFQEKTRSSTPAAWGAGRTGGEAARVHSERALPSTGADGGGGLPGPCPPAEQFPGKARKPSATWRTLTPWLRLRDAGGRGHRLLNSERGRGARGPSPPQPGGRTYRPSGQWPAPPVSPPAAPGNTAEPPQSCPAGQRARPQEPPQSRGGTPTALPTACRHTRAPAGETESGPCRQHHAGLWAGGGR